MCGDGEHHKVSKKKFNFNVFVSGRKYVSGAYTDTQIVGTNTNGDFQIILPQNVPQGRYNVSVRTLQIKACNEQATAYPSAVLLVKLYLDNLAMVNGYNNNNQSNNALFGVFDTNLVRYGDSLYGYDCDYHAGGRLPMTQQVSGIQSLQNGLLRIRITDQTETPLVIPGNTLSGGNWSLSLDFEYLGE